MLPTFTRTGIEESARMKGHNLVVVNLILIFNFTRTYDLNKGRRSRIGHQFEIGSAATKQRPPEATTAKNKSERRRRGRRGRRARGGRNPIFEDLQDGW